LLKKCNPENLKNSDFIKQHSGTIQVKWADGELESRYVDYYEQDHMYNIAKDAAKRDALFSDIY